MRLSIDRNVKSGVHLGRLVTPTGRGVAGKNSKWSPVRNRHCRRRYTSVRHTLRRGDFVPRLNCTRAATSPYDHRHLARERKPFTTISRSRIGPCNVVRIVHRPQFGAETVDPYFSDSLAQRDPLPHGARQGRCHHTAACRTDDSAGRRPAAGFVDTSGAASGRGSDSLPEGGFTLPHPRRRRPCVPSRNGISPARGARPTNRLRPRTRLAVGHGSPDGVA